MSVMKANMLVRTLSTSSAASQMVKAPIQVFGLEGRYAAALYSAASKTKALDAVEKELSHFQKSMKSDAKLKEFIMNPVLKRSIKADALKHVASKINMCATTSNLLGLLAENGRLNKLEAIINAFKIIMAAHRGEVTCHVVTAKPLDAAQKQNLEAALKKFLKGNETLQLTATVDPSLMGGMVVSIGDKYVDMSVASKVKKYTELISASA
ncbi:ATP synthase subunit O, mitochondrial [Zerene cesonia]|uniref:ATP synthase subunit O, mitochondrial n=1 Tax=Zerene cesonia TaxID=33412 RepID=UPI0018E56B28|nr:ATP synthase subunit O, mitochondrial [Zerene cesonia]